MCVARVRTSVGNSTPAVLRRTACRCSPRRGREGRVCRPARSPDGHARSLESRVRSARPPLFTRSNRPPRPQPTPPFVVRQGEGGDSHPCTVERQSGQSPIFRLGGSTTVPRRRGRAKESSLNHQNLLPIDPQPAYDRAPFSGRIKGALSDEAPSAPANPRDERGLAPTATPA